MSSGIPREENPLDAPPLPGSAGILVVDEDPAFQLGLKTFLREYVGFEKVFTAKSGQEALDFIRAEPSIEVVTLDYRMPGMSGIEVLQSLREGSFRPLAVLMITGYPSDELESEFHAMGTGTLLTTHFLPKPVEFEKLEHLVLDAHEEVLALKRRETEPSLKVDAEMDQGDLPLSALNRAFEEQSARLTDIELELKAQRGKWRSDFWKVAFLLFAFWLASQFGALEKVAPHWARLKETIAASFGISSPARSAGQETAETLPAAEIPSDAGENSRRGAADTAFSPEEGQPL